MKRFVKKTYQILFLGLVVWTLLFILYLAWTDQWLRLLKYCFIILFTFFCSFYEIPGMILWIFKKILKNNDFN